MPRLCTVWLACCFVFSSTSIWSAPSQSVLDALTTARNLLAQNKPSAAVALLEAQLQHANGDAEFKNTLRAAYLAELRSLNDAKAQDAILTKIALLGGPPANVLPAVAAPTLPKTGLVPLAQSPRPIVSPQPVAAPDTQGLDLLKQATTLFNEAKSADPRKFLDASKLFDLAFNRKVQLRNDQLAAWAYCRLKLAADDLNKAKDANDAAAVVAEIEDAMTLAKDHEGIRNVGNELLAHARKRAGSAVVAPARVVAPAGNWQLHETASFRVHYQGARELAEQVARIAEERRGTISEKWSGPLGGAWKPKCEVYLYPNGEAFAEATRLQASNTGRAEVQLKAGQILARKLELRADDATILNDALPRELTHIVLGDLFYDQAPPKWAEIGMAVLSTSETEQNRHLRTVSRCANQRELPLIADLLKSQEVPAKSVTGFYVESVSLVDFLVRAKGEKAFTTFLRDAQRYGAEAAIKRQYGYADVRELETAWLRANQLAAK